jgi:hypothetical protein
LCIYYSKIIVIYDTSIVTCRFTIRDEEIDPLIIIVKNNCEMKKKLYYTNQSMYLDFLFVTFPPPLPKCRGHDTKEESIARSNEILGGVGVGKSKPFRTV